MRDGYEIVFGATRRRKSLLPLARVCALVFFVVIAAGCGGKPMPVPTSGRVTFNGAPVGANKAAIRRGRIAFLPVESGEGCTLRAAAATLDRDGKYELSTFEPGDGVLPGEYNVVVFSLLSGPTMANPGAPIISEIPKRYERPGESGLSVTVPDQRAALTFDFELQR